MQANGTGRYEYLDTTTLGDGKTALLDADGSAIVVQSLPTTIRPIPPAIPATASPAGSSHAASQHPSRPR